MMKRMLLMLVVMTVIIAGLGFVKFQQIQTAIAQGASFQPPPEAVTTIVAQQVEWPDTLSAIGSVAAVQGVMVSADLSGTVDRVLFDSGRAVRQGEVLVELDTRQERAQLAAAEAQRDLARTNFDRMQGLLKDNVISRAEYDSATADDKQTEARAGEIRAAIQRKRITAPFSGILGIQAGQCGPVPVERRSDRSAPVAQSDLCELRRAAAGDLSDAQRARRADHDRRSRRSGVPRPHHGDRLGRQLRDAQHSGAGDVGESGRAAAAWHVRADPGRPRRRPIGALRCRRRPSAMRRTAIPFTSSPI